MGGAEGVVGGACKVRAWWCEGMRRAACCVWWCSEREREREREKIGGRARARELTGCVRGGAGAHDHDGFGW